MEKFIQLASGATESDIAKALTRLDSGGTLVLPKDAVIAVTKGLAVDVASRDIRINLNGSTLKQAGDASVILAYGHNEAARKVSLSASASGDAVITYTGAQSLLKPGDWIKVFADDPLPYGFQTGDAPTRLGQAMQIKDVAGDKVTLDGGLVYQELYSTNVRASRYDSGKLVIENGTIQGDQAHPSWGEPLVQIRTTIEAVLDRLTVRDGNSMGINVVDSVNALVQDAVVLNLKDDPAKGHYGYAVHSTTSSNTTVVGLYADAVRHATDNNSPGVTAGHAKPAKYGADIGLTVRDSVAYYTTNNAYGWHSEGVNGTVANSLAFDSYGFVGARGTGNSVTDSAGANLGKGILLYEYGDGDGRNMTFDNIHLKEVRDWGYMAVGQPTGNVIANSSFDVTNKGSKIGGAGRLENVVLNEGRASPDEAIAGTAGADKLLGGQGTDVITGGAGDDYLWGGAGADRLAGGAGRDRFAYHKLSEAGDTIADFDAARDIIDLSVMAVQLGWRGDLFAGDYVHIVQSGADALLQVDADGGGDDFVTLARLTGVRAADVTASGVQSTISGRDLPVEPNAQSQLPSAPAPEPESASKAESAATWQEGATLWTSLSSRVLEEGQLNLTYYGIGSFVGGGNALANVLIGGNKADWLQGHGGDDLLDGRGGTDAMLGGAGNDAYLVEDAGDAVTELAGEGVDTVRTSLSSYMLGPYVENLVYVGTERFTGTGNGLGNVITGGGGKDFLDGRAGADTLVGGAGDDTYIVDDARDVIVELVGGGVDRVRAQVSYTLGDNVETLQLTTNGTIDAIGNGLNNTLVGNANTNVLDGREGADTMSGGAGDDVYVVENAGDLVVEFFGEGRDLVRTTLSSYALGADVEDLIHLGAGRFTGVGNPLANQITGGAGKDSIDGGAGSDTMIGGAGDDTYIVENAGDVVVELAGGGTDRVLSRISYTLTDNIEALHLTTSLGLTGTGNGLANLLLGNGGANVLDGRGGADTLTGGAKADTFVLRAGETVGDTVTDFVRGTDKLAFYGYGADAMLSHAAGSDLYTVTSADGMASGSFRLTGVGDLDLSAGAGNTDAHFFA